MKFVDILKIVGLGLGLGGLTFLALFLIFWRKKDENTVPDPGHVASVDTSPSGLVAALDAARDRVRARIKAILQQGGGG